MCTEDQEVCQLVAHIQDCANALESRVQAIDEGVSGLPSSVKSQLFLALYSCRFMKGAILELRSRFPG